VDQRAVAALSRQPVRSPPRGEGRDGYSSSWTRPRDATAWLRAAAAGKMGAGLAGEVLWLHRSLPSF
jgi:hypothetical protein